MPTAFQTSRTAWITLALGLASVACWALALVFNFDLSDLSLNGVVVFWLLAVGSGVWSRIAIRRAGGRLSGRGLANWGMGVPTVGLVLGFLILPAARMVRDTGTRVASANNIKQIASAMRDYAEANNERLPPAAQRDKDGAPLLSWRVLILPYIEQGNLYSRFHLDEPWDSPNNLPLLSAMPSIYAAPPNLPAGARAGPSGTYYQVFVGEGTAFEGARGLRLRDDFPDGVMNTILVIEAGEPVPWTKPADLAYEADRPLPPLGGVFTGESRFNLFGPPRRKGIMVGMADGSFRFLPSGGPTESTLRHAITRNDGEKLGPEW